MFQRIFEGFKSNGKHYVDRIVNRKKNASHPISISLKYVEEGVILSHFDIPDINVCTSPEQCAATLNFNVGNQIFSWVKRFWI